MGYVKWTAADDEVVRELAGKESAASIGKRLGRTKGMILDRLHKLGIQGLVKGQSRTWTEENFAALKSVGAGLSSRDFARKHKLSEESVRWWARKLEIKFQPKTRWTPGQIEALRSCSTTDAAVARLGRSRRSVLRKAQEIGIVIAATHIGRPRGSKQSASAMNRKAGKIVRVVENAVRVAAVQWCPSCGCPASDLQAHYGRMPRCRVNSVQQSNPFGLLARQ